MGVGSNWKFFCVVLLAFFASIQAVMYFLKQNSTGYVYSHLIKFHKMLNQEFMMLLVSIFAFKRCKMLVSSPSSHASIPKEFRSLPHVLYSNDKDKISAPAAEQGPVMRVLGSILLLTVVAVLVSAHASFFLYYVKLSEEPTFLAYWCFLCLGAYLYLAFFLIGLSVANFILRGILILPMGQMVFAVCLRNSILKRLMLSSRLQTAIALLLTLLFVIQGVWSVSGSPAVTSIEIKLPRLAPEFDGFKIALLTDVHVGPTVGKRRVEDVVRIVNDLKIDAIAVVGDLVDGSDVELRSAVEPLDRLFAFRGAYYVTGNHEYYYGNIDKWFEVFESVGLTVLHNNHSVVETDTKAGRRVFICIAGVDDISAQKTKLRGHGMNISVAVSRCPSGSPVILLAHNPVSASIYRDLFETSKIGTVPVVDLILSGHTHGGNLYCLAPIVYFLFGPYFLGHYQVNERTQLFVGPGAYFWGAPMKMIGMSQIPVVILRSAV